MVCSILNYPYEYCKISLSIFSSNSLQNINHIFVSIKVIKLQLKIKKMKKSLLLILGLVSVMFFASCRNQEATQAVEETTEAVEEVEEAPATEEVAPEGTEATEGTEEAAPEATEGTQN